MKNCPNCGEDKDELEFYRKTKDRLQSWCKACFNSYCVKRWINKKIRWIDNLGGECSDCGGQFHYSVYEFHHLEDKEVDWTKLRLRSEAKTEQELAKCVLLCANCHRTRHTLSN